MDFRQQTVVCIASGPSLTAEDCELVRRSGFPTVAVNNSWELAPFCDVLYASDYAWWLEYRNRVTIAAERWTDNARAANDFKLNRFHRNVIDRNSGLMAVMFCEASNAGRVILLGFDCRAGLKTHFFGDHKNLSNPSTDRLFAFRQQFATYAPEAKVPIINCTRKTALTCFPCNPLEDELCLKLSREETPPKMNLNYALS